MAVLRVVLHPLVSAQTWRRWAYLVLGGAVLSPFLFVAAYPLAVVADLDGVLVAAVASAGVLVLVGVLVAVSLLPVVRRMEVAAATELLGGPVAGQVVPDVVHGLDRFRSGAFFCLHLMTGGVAGALTLTLVPLGVSWMLQPFTGWDPQGTGVLPAGRPAAAVLGGIACLLAFGYLCAAIGSGLARLAPRMLGRSAAQRLSEVEKLADDLSERNRLARELHDSVGHALSVVTVQAGAARRVLSQDPEFARDALGAVEESARRAAAELDHALAMLRDGTGGSRTLAQVEMLVRQTEAAGVSVHSTVAGPVDALPLGVSHDAFAIVQESLSNVVRHAPNQRVDLGVTVHRDAVELEVSNPLPGPGVPVTRHPSGGRGLPGIQERAHALGGTAEAGPSGDSWLVSVRLPLQEPM